VTKYKKFVLKIVKEWYVQLFKIKFFFFSSNNFYFLLF